MVNIGATAQRTGGGVPAAKNNGLRICLVVQMWKQSSGHLYQKC